MVNQLCRVGTRRSARFQSSSGASMGSSAFAVECNGALTKPQARTRLHAGRVSKGLGEQFA